MAKSGPSGHAASMSDRPVPAWLSFTLFAAIGSLVGLDLVLDAKTGLEWDHVLAELGVVGAAGGGAALFLRQWRRERASSRAALEQASEQARSWQAEADRWRAESELALRGLGEAIDLQFTRWKLTPAENEVGLLLLKGLSIKEVAEVRGTSERTAGQQARAIYRKGGLSGRAELSAFFLEDLLLPEAPSSGA